MSSIRGLINSKESWREWCVKTYNFFCENKYCQVTINDKRSLDQNSAIRVLYKQIYDHRGDMTEIEVERQCKLEYGVPLLRNECVVFNDMFTALERRYNYDQLLQIMDKFKVTSDDRFSVVMAEQMITQIMIDHPFANLDRNKKKD